MATSPPRDETMQVVGVPNETSEALLVRMNATMLYNAIHTVHSAHNNSQSQDIFQSISSFVRSFSAFV